MDDHQIDLLASIDTTHWTYRLRAERLRALIHDRAATPTILDVGSGPGGTTMGLSELGEVTAVDPSPAAAAWVAQRLPDVRFEAGRIDDLDQLLPDAAFDYVTCFHVLYHESVDDPHGAVGQLAARVAPGGRLIIEEPADERLRRRMDMDDCGSRRFTLDELKSWLESHGLEIEEADYLHRWAWPVARVVAGVDRVLPESQRAPVEVKARRRVDEFAYRLGRRELEGRAGWASARRGVGCWLVAKRTSVVLAIAAIAHTVIDASDLLESAVSI